MGETCVLVVGLTGGIASGKTTVANLFSQLGVPIIDTDQLARDVVEPGTMALQQIQQKFGADILNDHGQLNRRLLREKIFRNQADKQWLERLLHPLIRDQVLHKITQLQAPYCLVVIPLLVENKINYVDRVLVVDCAQATQLKRAMARDNMQAEQAKAILASQASRAERLAQANDIIHNDDQQQDLAEQVQALHSFYLQQGNKNISNAS